MEAVNPRPLRDASAALTVARAHVGKGTYKLGTGDINTPDDGEFDCAGFVSNKCYGIPRHRKGFNVGSWASVSDDLNSNSAIEDSDHARDIYQRASIPAPGVLLVYPTIRIKTADGKQHVFVGHEAMIEDVSRVLEWDPKFPDWSLLTIIQCIGPNGRHPGIVRSDGSHFNHHDAQWPKPEHRTCMLRVLP